MVSILRKPFGFSVVYFLFSMLGAFLTQLLTGGAVQNDTLAIAVMLIPYIVGIVFTFLYSLFVDAHLSHTFRWHASVYITIIAGFAALIFAALVNSSAVVGLLTNWRFWLDLVLSLLITYAVITIGNWLASLVIKNRGHI